MTTSINRAQFLRGDFSGKSFSPRPPWALPESEFTDLCTRCDDCASACFDNLIVKARGGYPIIDFSRGGCDFCEDCVDACKPGALKKISEETPPWSLVASIGQSCLAINAVTCRSCGDACDQRAISFQLQIGGKATPHLDQQSCNGCGLCFAVCPVKAVEISTFDSERGTMKHEKHM